jgi:Family of unknown function (DUF6444)
MEIRFTAYEKKLAALEAKDAEIECLKMEVAVLRKRLGQNSSNSSRPPSSDPMQASRRSRREGSDRKQGAQVGHPGAGRALKPVEEVMAIIGEGTIIKFKVVDGDLEVFVLHDGLKWMSDGGSGPFSVLNRK